MQARSTTIVRQGGSTGHQYERLAAVEGGRIRSLPSDGLLPPNTLVTPDERADAALQPAAALETAIAARLSGVTARDGTSSSTRCEWCRPIFSGQGRDWCAVRDVGRHVQEDCAL
jgi:hypothetical protein